MNSSSLQGFTCGVENSVDPDLRCFQNNIYLSLLSNGLIVKIACLDLLLNKEIRNNRKWLSSLAQIYFMSQHMWFWYLSNGRKTKTQTSLRKYTDSPEPSLPVYSKIRCRGRLRTRFRPLTPLDTLACSFIGDFCSYAMITKYERPNCRTTRTQASLRKCADSLEPSLLAYTKFRYRWRLISKFRPLTPLDTLACSFIGGFCSYAMITKRFLYLPHCRTTMTQTSLRKCADSARIHKV